jgi:hypothetical protein
LFSESSELIVQDGHAAKTVDPFSIADRVSVLADADLPPVAQHVAQAEKHRLTYEQLWRNVQRHLVDVAVAEEGFDRRFFGERYGPEVHTLTLSRAISTVVEGLETYLMNSFDAPGLLLLVALSAAHRRLMLARTSQSLDSYFDRLVMLIWPRFKAVFDANVQAIKAAGNTPKKFAPIDFNVNPVTRRYAEFVSSILFLHRSLADQQMSDGMLPHHMYVVVFAAVRKPLLNHDCLM